jgi:hypothetical protein
MKFKMDWKAINPKYGFPSHRLTLGKIVVGVLEQEDFTPGRFTVRCLLPYKDTLKTWTGYAPTLTEAKAEMEHQVRNWLQAIQI